MNHEPVNNEPHVATQKTTDRAPAQSPSVEQIQAWLISNISAVVEVDPQTIDIQKPLEYYGMDSMQAMHLSGDLEDWLGRQLSPTVVWDYPTIELLATHLAQNNQ
jgi:acyl carrier protein